MNNSEAFKKAHALTRAILRAGDDYRVTFGACLKQVKEEAKQGVSDNLDKALNIAFTIMFVFVAVLSVGFIGFLFVNTMGEFAAAMFGLAVLTMTAGALLIMFPKREIKLPY